MGNLIGEFTGFVAIGVSFFIYWQNDRKKLLFFKLIVDVLWSTHFLFIGGYTAMFTTVISIFREIAFVKRERYLVLKKRIAPISFCFFYILAAIFTWKGVQSLLPAIASCFSTIAFYHNKVNKIRVWSLLTSVLMFFNGIACHSIANIMNEVITVLSIISGTVRSKKLEKERFYVSSEYTLQRWNKVSSGILGIATGMSVHARQVIEVQDNIYSMSIRFQVEGEVPYEPISVLIYELEGEDAEYSGMARTYRNYQLAYSGFKKINDRLTPQLDYATKSVYVRIRQGWKPVPTQIEEQTPENEPSMYVACTFKQVEKLVEEYYKAGIRDAEFCLVGWNIKGHDGRWPQIFPVEASLGGEEDLRKLICKAKALGFEISCHTNFTNSFSIAENFDIENTVVDRQGERPSETVWAGGRSYTVCPEKAYENAKQQLPKVAELGFGGLNYIDVITCVTPPACYHLNHQLTNREGQNYWKNIFELSRELFGGVSSEGPSDYCMSECDYCLYTSFSREPEKEWELFDKEVPFWQIVYHGICLYNSYSRTVNSALSQNPANLLKSLECGDRPTVYYYSKFKSDGKDWMGDKDFRCGTEEEIQEGIEALKKQYDIFKKMEYLQTVFIESHKEISANVFEVKYEDGSVVTADYNKLTLSLKNYQGIYSVVL